MQPSRYEYYYNVIQNSWQNGYSNKYETYQYCNGLLAGLTTEKILTQDEYDKLKEFNWKFMYG